MHVSEYARKAYQSIIAAAKRITAIPGQIPLVWVRYRRRVGLWLALALCAFAILFLLSEFVLVILLPIMNPEIFGGLRAAAAMVALGPLAVLLLAWKLNPRIQALIRRLLQRNHTP